MNAADASLPAVLFVSLGGTITMTGGSGPGITPTLTADDLIATVPALADIARIDTASPFRLPGAHLTLAHLRELAGLLQERLAGDIAGAVVVQGTDTIEETAFALDLLVDSNKPIVVTGAMRGPQQPGADGPANVLAAIVTAASEAARGLGTLVVLEDTIHAARFVQKNSTALPSAFVSANAGPLGHVVENEARIIARVERQSVIASGAAGAESPVALYTASLGDDGRYLSGLPDLGYRGLVIEALGAGHLPDTLIDTVSELATRMPVVLSTRVRSGPVFRRTYGFPGSEIDLLGRGLIHGGALGGPKARLLLSFLIGTGLTGQKLATAFAARA